MKKRLEAELISIAHRVLKLKNKSEVDQLLKESQKLYETLTILKFYQDNFEAVKNEISEVVLEEKLTTVAVEEDSKEEEVQETKSEITLQEEQEPQVSEEESIEKEKEEETNEEEKLAFTPIFQMEAEEEIEIKEEEKPIAFDDLLGADYSEPVFVRPNDVTLFSQEEKEEPKVPKSSLLNETLSKHINVGLNDRIGFVQHLFGDSNEDFNRVLSQLNTFDTFEEAKNFIEDMVKPDYNDWKGKEEFEERFMELVEKKFQ